MKKKYYLLPNLVFTASDEQARLYCDAKESERAKLAKE
jgi:hypothetical protein